jgi:hypothetical protein
MRQVDEVFGDKEWTATFDCDKWMDASSISRHCQTVMVSGHLLIEGRARCNFTPLLLKEPFGSDPSYLVSSPLPVCFQHFK